MTTFATATTPEHKIAARMGMSIAELGEKVSYQKVGNTYVVNTADTRWDFDSAGNLIMVAYVGNDNDKVINPNEFDWDTLD